MTKVKFIEKNPSKEQIQWGEYTNPKGLLKVGKIYKVDRVEVYSWHTKIFLKDYPNQSFNSVWFKEVK